jgi:predicted ester cyclase
MNLTEKTQFAEGYAEAWCSQDPEKVAAFYARKGSISVNGAPSLPIVEVARGFMRDFPDMIVTFGQLEPRGDRTAFHWTFTGTNAGPGGTGNKVRISGYELWQFNQEGLIQESQGYFDSADYYRQLQGR